MAGACDKPESHSFVSKSEIVKIVNNPEEINVDRIPEKCDLDKKRAHVQKIFLDHSNQTIKQEVPNM